MIWDAGLVPRPFLYLKYMYEYILTFVPSEKKAEQSPGRLYYVTCYMTDISNHLRGGKAWEPTWTKLLHSAWEQASVVPW